MSGASVNSTMRVLVLAEYYPPDTNASGLRIHEMINTFLKQKGVEIRVVVYNPVFKSRHLRYRTKISDKLDVVRYKRKYLPRLFHVMQAINPFTLFCCTFISMKETINYKPNIIITTVPSFIPTIAAYITSVICKKLCCIDIRDDWVNPRMGDYAVTSLPRYGKYPSEVMYRILHRLFLRSCKNALLISIVYKTIRNDLFKYINPKIPTLYVPNGINFSKLEKIRQKTNLNEVLRKHGIFSNRKTIIYVGKIEGYYKPEIMLDPLEKLIKKGYKVNYIIVGNRKSENMIKEMVIKKGIKDYVFLLGRKEHAKILELLLVSDLGFYALSRDYPSPDCALGVKVLEYIACRLPILSVAVNESVVSKLISEHKVGVALSWDEIYKMDVVIEEVLNSKEHYLRNIERYYPSFVRQFSRETNNIRLYTELVKYFNKNKG